MKSTEKLGLKKPDLTDYVNIGDLNDNMDVLDEAVGELKEGSAIIEDLETTNKSLVGAINELDGEVKSHETEFDAHKAEIVSQVVGKGADIIGLPDPNNLFTATNVGGAMQELFQNVSSGKSLIAAAVTGKGVSTSGSDTFSAMATKIEQISTGKKWAEGTMTTDKFAMGSVSGLDFKPRVIITKSISANSNAISVYFEEYSTSNYLYVRQTGGGDLVATYTPLSDNDGYVIEGAFRIMGHGTGTGRPWFAFE